MAFRVLLDACALVPYHLSNVLLTLAEVGLFTPLWSEQILRETERTLVRRLGIDSAKAHRRIDNMRKAFPEALVEHYEGLIPAMRCHRKDRHVLAAAVRGDAQIMVTANLRDFPDAAAAPYDIEISHPDSFLWDQLDLDAPAMRRAIDLIVTRFDQPKIDDLD